MNIQNLLAPNDMDTSGERVQATAVQQQPNMEPRPTVGTDSGSPVTHVRGVGASTAVLLATGSTTPMANVKVGDAIFATVREGPYRRFAVAEVLDRRSSVNHAYAVMLQDGTELIAGGDHRLLTLKGWKYVTGSEYGPRRRPYLTVGARLAGPGGIVSPRVFGSIVKHGEHLRVVSIRLLAHQTELVDVTTGTGDFIAGGVIQHDS